ncbi:MAG: hypothetical protein HY22_00985 [[Candidatus Thermochlorobacteriaceae] bacterium GBChlB]|nr:MAG: hypothetical protein HY22_00985 [[Candidatus Thermochlorobacteriaceae] bacterium GBChlB]
MQLSELIKSIAPIERQDTTQDVEISSIAYDSRVVKDGSLFVALRGFKVDGHSFIENALSQKAAAIVCEEIPNGLTSTAAFIKVPNTRIALSQLSKAFYGNASDKLKLIGVTGTNGKTTTTLLIKSMLEANGIKTGLIGTIAHHLGDEIIEAERTTPEALELHQFFDKMTKSNCAAAVMEVSSHSLALHRTDGLRFDVAVFTNLSRDHLDFHGTMENYFQAKKLLFDRLSADAVAITNIDDDYGSRIVSDTKAKTMTYSVSENIDGSKGLKRQALADVQATAMSYQLSGTTASIQYKDELHTHAFRHIGKFNLYNVLAAYSVGRALNLSDTDVVRGLAKCDLVRGRMEQIWSSDHRCAIVDYAHSPDALLNVMRAVREIMPKEGKLVVAFGCGGDRDKGKRPMMGQVAEENADVVILTSDNPRSEHPEMILNDIEAGMKKNKPMYRIENRAAAIRKGIELIEQGDVLLVAGKGHETYQEIDGVKHHFDDREVIEKIFREQAKTL